MPYTYLLRCADDSLYVGSTHDLARRVDQHNAGRVEGHTASRRPVELVWFQEFDDIGEAWAMEQKVKGWRRAKKLALVAGRFADLPALCTAGPHESVR
ncbi:GIY-YIG nuclease family protein [Microlunatus ginsengisoli]